MQTPDWLILFPLILAFAVFLPIPAKAGTMGFNQARPMPPLSEDEKSIIENKGTERAYSGAYDKHDAAGAYLCRRCGALLYFSEHKFPSGCGWPSFDAEIPGAVLRRPDGARTEIICANCQAHLGHVFTGEGFTPANVRHCVNSAALSFLPADKLETAYFAGGCFWGVEHLLRGLPGVLAVTSGYMGGKSSNPTYEEVSSGTSGHAETVRVIFDPELVSYGRLARRFFEIHDPTQLNRQGLDHGTQYRSAVFTVNAEQEKTIAELLEKLREKGWKPVTGIERAEKFYQAEGYHQRYLEKHPERPCHLPFPRFERGPEQPEE